VITFAFLVEQPMKTGQRRYSVCQTSVVIKSGSESLTSISERDHLASRKLRTGAYREGKFPYGSTRFQHIVYSKKRSTTLRNISQVPTST
jgi:hypothetical protein